ncbi:hypothetical protein [Pleurocapsa sp. FMAR1]|uniref:hypothetical protein n=1 Tax=Pleurocapsa sp. FMAR1 TaxID=3040204 RepID=UPI0029C7ED25|nr:hypothetical protein [Pleurocapsa sp. FMAR1]
MLSQIVRPMVNTQIHLLAKSKATKITLIRTIAKWLGFLGVEAQVNQLNTTGDKIQVSITVGQPENSDRADWQKILDNLSQDTSKTTELTVNHSNSIPVEQEAKYYRILAYAIQMGDRAQATDWSKIHPQLQGLGLKESTILGVKSALKVPQSIDRLVKDLDADVAAIALSQAASIALLDRQVNPEEYQVMQTLLKAMTDNCR